MNLFAVLCCSLLALVSCQNTDNIINCFFLGGGAIQNIASNTSCTQFFKCDNAGNGVRNYCPAGTVFNPTLGLCDSSSRCALWDSRCNSVNSGVRYFASSCCSRYFQYSCSDGGWSFNTCGSGTVFNTNLDGQIINSGQNPCVSTSSSANCLTACPGTEISANLQTVCESAKNGPIANEFCYFNKFDNANNAFRTRCPAGTTFEVTDSTCQCTNMDLQRSSTCGFDQCTKIFTSNITSGINPRGSQIFFMNGNSFWGNMNWKITFSVSSSANNQQYNIFNGPSNADSNSCNSGEYSISLTVNKNGNSYTATLSFVSRNAIGQTNTVSFVANPITASNFGNPSFTVTVQSSVDWGTSTRAISTATIQDANNPGNSQNFTPQNTGSSLPTGITLCMANALIVTNDPAIGFSEFSVDTC